ncbi:MAG: IclR family transcriptional regulator [Desulfobacterales bacterium]|nr:IclR family transcriptional regulator [Desulfobacterales bacterium]
MGKDTLNTKVNIQAGTQSVRRTTQILKMVAKNNDRGIKLSEIVRKVTLPTATVHRLLSALFIEGFIDFDSVSKRYYIGNELYSIGVEAEKFAIKRKYRFCLERISDHLRVPVYLIVRTGYDSQCIDYVEGITPFRAVSSGIGIRTALGFGAASLAYLSFLDNKEIDSVLKANKLRYKKYHNITVTKIKKLIKETRERGYVYSKGFHYEGIDGVAVPVYNEQGVVSAAISVSYLSNRIDLNKSKKVAEFIKSEIDLIN